MVVDPMDKLFYAFASRRHVQERFLSPGQEANYHARVAELRAMGVKSLTIFDMTTTNEKGETKFYLCVSHDVDEEQEMPLVLLDDPTV